MGPYFLGCWAVDTRLVISIYKKIFISLSIFCLFYKIKKEKQKKKSAFTHCCVALGKSPSFQQKTTYKTLLFCRPTTVDDGSHNVSRWMTWLPISLKNAAKCDKWYQLQNLSITESLNANGTWKKILVVQLQVCHDLSVEQKPRKKTRFFFRQILCLSVFSKEKRLGAVASIKNCTRLCECYMKQKTAFFPSFFFSFFYKKRKKNGV